MIDRQAIRQRWDADGSKRDERGRRLFAASEVRAAGWGGLAAVSDVTGLARSTIERGLKNLDAPPLAPGRVRRDGGGPRQLTERDPTLLADLKRLVEPATLGDPMRPLLWVSKSLDKLATTLTGMGHAISPNSVRKLLCELGFSRQTNRKAEEGSKHPDRNAQFEYINAEVVAAQAADQPVISVDTKKKELIGNYRNGGTDYRPKGDPRRVKVHDFEDKNLGKVAPYGVYDIAANSGWVSVGITHDTAEFAVSAIRTWLEKMGRQRYPSRARADDHGRLWRLERRAGAAVEGRAAEVRRRDGTRDQGPALSAGHIEESRPKELHLRPLAERCVSLSTHTAPIRQTRRQYFDASVRTVCAACWQWTQSFGQPVFSAHYSAYTSALPTLSA